MFAPMRAVARDPEGKVLLAGAATMVAVGMVVYHVLEGWSFLDPLYFSVVTLATVGFGDLTPTTDLAKLFTVGYITVGIGIVAAFASELTKFRRSERMGETLRVAALAGAEPGASERIRRSGGSGGSDGSGESDESGRASARPAGRLTRMDQDRPEPQSGRRRFDVRETAAALVARFVPITAGSPRNATCLLRPDLVGGPHLLGGHGAGRPGLCRAGGRAARSGPRHGVRRARGVCRLRHEQAPQGHRQLDDGDHVRVAGRRHRGR